MGVMDGKLPEAFMTKYEALRAERGDLVDLTREQALNLFADLAELICSHTPAEPRPLIVTNAHLLKCPWCDEEDAELDLDEYGAAFDMRSASVFDAKMKVLGINFAGSEWNESGTTGLVHRSCYNAVELPEGWEVEYL